MTTNKPVELRIQRIEGGFSVRCHCDCHGERCEGRFYTIEEARAFQRGYSAWFPAGAKPLLTEEKSNDE